MGLFCAQAGRCAGCRLINIPFAEELEWKRRTFLELWARHGLPSSDPAGLVIEQLGEGGLRDRCDMTLHEENGRTVLGLWDWDKTEILDLAQCPQMTRGLASWFTEFRGWVPGIQFGNVRLRVSPSGERGVWLDFPNRTIDAMLADGAWLDWLAERAVVELGQKHQRLERRGPKKVLGNPVPNPWFETYLGEELRPWPLSCTIGAFTQPGFRINRLLVERVTAFVQATRIGSWLELGAGIGNFTLPLASLGLRVTAADMNPLSLRSLRRSAEEAGLVNSIECETLNIHHGSARLRALTMARPGILADPPRSGLGSFVGVLAEMAPSQRPNAMVYVSCSAESMIGDIAGLYALGYGLKRIMGIDQFPRSEHCEWIGLLVRDEALAPSTS